MTKQEAIEAIKANYPPENYTILREALDMTIALLEEQEAVEPVTDNEGEYWCGSCHEDMVWHQKYCSNCGKRVKWSD